MIIGYTTGVFDLLHIGHINLLRNAKSMCDKLIVGVSENSSYKNKEPVQSFEDRMEIVRCLRFVDLVVPQKNMDKLSVCKKLNVDVLFHGDDWYNTELYNNYERELKAIGVKVMYLPHTSGISSTLISAKLHSEVNFEKN